MTHIYPINDLQEHEMSSTCFCNPQIKDAANGELLCVHNSLDGREAVEVANELLNGIDRDKSKYEENDYIKFRHSGRLYDGNIISIQYNPIQYFVIDSNGEYWHIDENSVVE